MSEDNNSVVEPQENPDQNEENSSSYAGASEGGEGNSLNSAAAEVIDAIEPKEGESEEEGSEEEKKAEEVIKKLWKLKVGGKEIEIDNEEELIKRAQMGYSADEKWQEASNIKKEMDAFVQALQKDPGSALVQMGFDVDQLAEKHIQQRIEEMQKSPEQVERESLQKEIENLRSEREKEKETARQHEMSRMQEQYALQIETDISDALDISKNLPKSPYVVKRIADGLLLAMNNGYPDVTVADILPMVENDIKSEIREMFSAMPEELVEAVVGKDVLNKMRKTRVKKAKQATNKPKIQATGESEIKQAQKRAQSKPKEQTSAKDFFKNLGSY